MTDEELDEYNRLVARYNNLRRENRMLEVEVETGIENCYIVSKSIQAVAASRTKDMKILSNRTGNADCQIDNLYKAIVDISNKYFVFKNLSTATKNVTQYSDEYYTKFRLYNGLRRITLGYVIGIDSHIVSSEKLRKKVEKVYLANTDYWLAYAITAVMLWASNEKEAAERALNKSMSMDCYKSCVFFMLINLRFERLDVARNWYLTMLDKTDVNDMSDEWQYVLKTYLVGAMNNDEEFIKLTSTYFNNMLEKTIATNADFNKKTISTSYNFAANFIHFTEKEFLTLEKTCSQYSEMKTLTSNAEKITALALYFENIYQMQEEEAQDIYVQLENILYELINAYEKKEFEVIKSIKLNEAIVEARGNIEIANKKFKDQYGDETAKKSFGDLILKWAFSEDYKQTSIVVKQFALSYLKDKVSEGMRNYFEDQSKKIKDKYTFVVGPPSKIQPCTVTCDENQFDSMSQVVNEHYRKNKFNFMMADKKFKIFLLICLSSLILFGIAAMTVETIAFPVLLTLGIVAGIVGGFLVWRRSADIVSEIEELCRLATIELRKSLDELREWKKLIKNEFSSIGDLNDAIDKF
ncbi:MAG: hypothetical protein R3Y27_04780 [Clostridia bacterium]